MYLGCAHTHTHTHTHADKQIKTAINDKMDILLEKSMLSFAAMLSFQDLSTGVTVLKHPVFNFCMLLSFECRQLFASDFSAPLVKSIHDYQSVSPIGLKYLTQSHKRLKGNTDTSLPGEPPHIKTHNAANIPMPTPQQTELTSLGIKVPDKSCSNPGSLHSLLQWHFLLSYQNDGHCCNSHQTHTRRQVSRQACRNTHH